ncbi:MAG TPA: phosphate ABC transporter substrate-binding protein PstS [Thermoplasmata archaeon]|nr:phosphate ABC transporter substrate-binding protein PstS [Thermoplasmata archaeon]
MSATDSQSPEKEEIIQHPKSRRGLILGVVAVVVVVALVGGGLATNWFGLGSSGTQAITLLGAGSTFAYPIITLWAAQYKNATGVQVNYNGIGSGGGINGIEQKTLDFGGTDAPLNGTAHGQYPSLLTIPESLGAITVAYNLPGVPIHVNLTGPVVAQIFMGNITNWNDTAIKSLNPGVSFPDATIIPVHRSDSSGTTFAFSDYLSHISTTFKQIYGTSKTINWPKSELAGNGNQGVANTVQQTKNAVGYVELAYALQIGMSYAKIMNHDGNNYVLPTLQTTQADAANASATLPAGNGDWSHVTIVNAPGSNSYPICTFTYLLVYLELNVYPSGQGSGQMNQAKAQALVAFLWWAIHSGQPYAKQLSYVPLPTTVVTNDETTIRSMTFNGAALQTGA